MGASKILLLIVHRLFGLKKTIEKFFDNLTLLYSIFQSIRINFLGVKNFLLKLKKTRIPKNPLKWDSSFNMSSSNMSRKCNTVLHHLLQYKPYLIIFSGSDLLQ